MDDRDHFSINRCEFLRHSEEPPSSPPKGVSIDIHSARIPEFLSWMFLVDDPWYSTELVDVQDERLSEITKGEKKRRRLCGRSLGSKKSAILDELLGRFVYTGSQELQVREGLVKTRYEVLGRKEHDLLTTEETKTDSNQTVKD
ncbi:hypothetical protein M7I_2126 [Glarea lozoyensis 74030]|uniref:Uncharacterized protein n=1 Tax=Glarea lozoyensis (strain ATCC 74030 / MF5533) TaxID=1104152 RepID=H0EHY3_GLAL7|nr:hypothetical protein M7I_2126 [Glarea lozoyensis 74030]